MKRPYIPLGCDQQGRYSAAQPMPAEAATEIGADDREEMTPAEGWILMTVVILSACFSAWLFCVLAEVIKEAMP